jgi:polyphosphate kinase
VFPVFDPQIKKQVLDLCDFQLRDNTKARILGPDLEPAIPNQDSKMKLNAQLAAYAYVKALQEKILMEKK